MTHLYIEQNTGLIEEVSREVISKLYELASSGDLDQTSDLKGRLHTASAPKTQVDYLNQTYSDLFIVADKLTISFEDAEVQRLLENMLNKTGLDANDLSAVTSIVKTNGFKNNSRITSLNDLQLLNHCTIIDEQALDGITNVTTIKLPPLLRTLKDLRRLPKLKGLRIPSTCTGNSDNGSLMLRDMGSLELLVIDGTIDQLNMDESDGKFVGPLYDIVINGSVNSIVICANNWGTWGGTIWVDDVATYQAKSGFSSYTSSLAPKSSMPQALQDAVDALA